MQHILNKHKSPWSAVWYLPTLPVYFVLWWYGEYIPFLWKVLGRIDKIFIEQISLGLVIRRFFTPWKNSNTAAGWIAGFIFKIIYLSIVVPIWLIFQLLLLAIFIIAFAFWILIIPIILIFALR